MKKEKTWKDLTLSQGVELALLDIDDHWEMVCNQMAICLDTTMDEIESKPAALVYEFIHEYKFIMEMPKMKKLDHFKVKGKWYKLIDLTKMSLAQMVDIEEYYSMGLVENLHKILSVLYLPATKNIFGKWKIEEYVPDVERENIFLDLDMERIWGTTLFFWTGVQTYINALKVYSNQETEKMTNMKLKED